MRVTNSVLYFLFYIILFAINFIISDTSLPQRNIILYKKFHNIFNFWVILFIEKKMKIILARNQLTTNPAKV